MKGNSVVDNAEQAMYEKYGNKQIDAEQLYADVLDNYKTALSQGYDIADAELNYMCSYYDDVSIIGYAYMDVDNNGVEELLIGDCEGHEIFDIYTVVDGMPYLVCQSSERSWYSVCTNGSIACEGAGSASAYSLCYYTLTNSGNLDLSEAVLYDSDIPDDVEACFYSTTSESIEDASPISLEKAEQISSKYDPVEISFAPIVPSGSVATKQSPSVVADSTGEYDDIAGTYIDENQYGFYMFIGYEDSSKTTAYVSVALAIDDFSVKVQNREGDQIFANDLDESIASEPSYAADLDCSQPGKILANIYISEYDYNETIAFVPYPDASYPNPYYVG